MLDKKILSIIIITLLIGGVIGYIVGFTQGVKTTINQGLKVFYRLMELKKIEFNIDQKMLEMGLFQYQNNINSCLFLQENTKNASLYSN